ncbi:unnamed protein product [Nippostrongylus brasiliensis]|uniref:Ion_trans_2 domain-containing protein n=1 Tax=Nippostrongylus brasiliensis TaxID=27835 RepID=A0A0N4XK84_NIPBR|nr:unnamed protein product [Nippostrongylus brasiliensis]
MISTITTFQGALNGSVTKNVSPVEKKKRRRKRKIEEAEAPPEPVKPKVVITHEDKRNKTLWRHMIWLVVLFAYSLLGGLIFSAIEGAHRMLVLIPPECVEKRVTERCQAFLKYGKPCRIISTTASTLGMRSLGLKLNHSFRDIDMDKSISNNRRGTTLENYKLHLARTALNWYEKKLGLSVEEPMMRDSKWNLWGGVYYAASLYTTIGYGNFFPRTTSGRIISMLYAFFGIPLVFTILCEWGFLYFTWIEYGWNWVNEKFCQK